MSGSRTVAATARTAAAALLATALLFSCNSYLYLFGGVEPEISNYYALTSGESTSLNGLRVSIDEKYEAYGVIRVLLQLNDGGMMVNETDNPDYAYLRSVLEYFAPYRDSEVIERAREMYTWNFPVDAAPEVVQYLDDQLALRGDVEISPEWLQFFGGDRWILFFIDLLQDFMNLTDFNAFYEANRAFYASVLSDYRAAIEDWEFTREIEGYFGDSRAGYTIVLEPLQRGGNFGFDIASRDTTGAHAFLYFRIRGFSGSVPSFHDDSARETLRHEFAHVFCNPLVEQYWCSLWRYDRLRLGLDGQAMGEQGYGDPPSWKTMAYEHIARAVATRLAFLESEENGLAELDNQVNAKGFIYVEGLCRSLATYEGNRGTYPRFADYFPILIKAFGEYL